MSRKSKQALNEYWINHSRMLIMVITMMSMITTTIFLNCFCSMAVHRKLCAVDALKAFIKLFEAPQRSVKIKI